MFHFLHYLKILHTSWFISYHKALKISSKFQSLSKNFFDGYKIETEGVVS